MTETIVLNTEAARQTEAEKPVVDWDKVSIGALQGLLKYRVKPQRLNIMMTLFSEGRLPDKHVDELLELSSVDWEAEAQADTIKMFAGCVKSVPRDWLADDAPKSLDFGNVSTYAYLKPKKLQDLVQFIHAGESAAGN